MIRFEGAVNTMPLTSELFNNEVGFVKVSKFIPFHNVLFPSSLTVLEEEVKVFRSLHLSRSHSTSNYQRFKDLFLGLSSGRTLRQTIKGEEVLIFQAFGSLYRRDSLEIREENCLLRMAFEIEDGRITEKDLKYFQEFLEGKSGDNFSHRRMYEKIHIFVSVELASDPTLKSFYNKFNKDIIIPLMMEGARVEILPGKDIKDKIFVSAIDFKSYSIEEREKLAREEAPQMILDYLT